MTIVKNGGMFKNLAPVFIVVFLVCLQIVVAPPKPTTSVKKVSTFRETYNTKEADNLAKGLRARVHARLNNHQNTVLEDRNQNFRNGFGNDVAMPVVGNNSAYNTAQNVGNSAVNDT